MMIKEKENALQYTKPLQCKDYKLWYVCLGPQSEHFDQIFT